MDDTSEMKLEKFIREPIQNDDYQDIADSICFCLMDYAREYLHNVQANELEVTPKLRKALLVDSINYVYACLKNGREFGLNAQYLASDVVEDVSVELKSLLNIVLKEFGNYLARDYIAELVVDHQAFTDYKYGFDDEVAEVVLFDFIRFIAMKNHFDINNELIQLKKKIMRKKYPYQGKVGSYQKRLETESFEQIYEKELEAMIIAFLNTEKSINTINDGFLKGKVLTYKNKNPLV